MTTQTASEEKPECPVCGAFSYPCGTLCGVCRDHKRRAEENRRFRRRVEEFGGGYD